MSRTIEPLGAGMTAEQWREHLSQLKNRFLAHNAITPDAPFASLPELRLPRSGIADLNFAGGETEGLVM